MPNWRDNFELCQTKAPLWEEIRRYAGHPLLALHTPGHKNGIALGNGWDEPGLLSKIDLSEISALRWAESWEEAETLAASFFKADRSFFLVQGASQGVMASLLGAFCPGDAILVARNCHVSVINGIILAGLTPIFIRNEFLSDWGLVVGPDRLSLETRLNEHPDVKGLILTNPTYQGIARPIIDYREIIGDERLLVVDEAHGGHFGWMGYEGYDAFSQADLWIHGTHKTLGSLTQTGMLHLSGKRIEPGRIRRALQLLTTTSPSYILLASLDSNRRFLANAGQKMFFCKLDQIRELRDNLISLRGLDVVREPKTRTTDAVWVVDPWRICLSFRNFGITGFQAEARYRNDYQIQPEYSDQEQVTFFIAPWQGEHCLELLYKATLSLWEQFSTHQPPDTKQDKIVMPPLLLPHAALNPREAALGRMQVLPLSEAVGKIAAAMIAPYPPGVPLLIPGEIIRDEDIQFITGFIKNGGEVRGIRSGMIPVCM